MAARIARLLRVDEVELAVGRVVDVAVLDAVEVGAALVVVPGQRLVEFAEPHRYARPAQVQVVIVPWVPAVAVVVEDAVFDDLVDGRRQRPVAVRHHSHVIVVDLAVADRDVVRLIDADAGAVVAAVVRAGQVEALDDAIVRAAVELEHRPRRAAAPAVVEPLARQLHALPVLADRAAEGQAGFGDIEAKLLIRPPVGQGMDEDHVTGLRGPVCVFDASEPLAGPDLQRPRRQQARAQQDGRDPPRRA